MICADCCDELVFRFTGIGDEERTEYNCCATEAMMQNGANDHPGLCCDCFDVRHGCPETETKRYKSRVVSALSQSEET